jgi:KDO2-lipid IV(A) lauroyltransferase
MHFILTGITVFFIFLFGILPFWLLYLFSDFARFVLQHIMGYRKKVIRGNLERCFPEKSKKEIDKLVSGAYKNLTDVLVEGLKAFTMSDRQIKERHHILNPEILSPYKNSGKSFIATPCHYGNWEWGSMSPSLYFDYPIVVFFTPLSNPYLNKFIGKNRGRTGGILTSTRETTKTFDERTNIESIYIMAADQSPSKASKAIWVNFLGQETAFLDGPERHARLRDIPVIFTDIQRVKRGHYELRLSFISEDPKNTKVGEITTAYAKKLEEAINNKPENWLWSHKRWKLKRNT